MGRTIPAKRNVTWLLIGIIGLSVVSGYINVTAPANIGHIVIFFVLISASVFAVSFFAFAHMRRSILCTTGIMIWMILRYLHLRHFLYPVLLWATILSLEWLLSRTMPQTRSTNRRLRARAPRARID